MGWVEMTSLWISCILPKNNSFNSAGKNQVTKKWKIKREFRHLSFSLNSLMNMTRDWSDLLVYAWLNRLFSSTLTSIS